MKLLRRLISTLAAASDRRQIAILMAVAAVLIAARLCMPLQHEICRFTDAPTYIAAQPTILSGEIEVFRTPGYPLLMWICGNDRICIILVQFLAFWLSIPFFFKGLRYVCGKSVLPFIGGALYAWNLNMLSWAVTDMTEMICVSLFSVMLCCLCGLLGSGERKTALAFAGAIVHFVLIMFKPIFLCATPIWLLVILHFALNKNRKLLIVSVCATAVLALGVHCYCSAYKSKFGVYTLSAVGTYNQYFTYRYHYDFVENPRNMGEGSNWTADSISIYGQESAKAIVGKELFFAKSQFIEMLFFAGHEGLFPAHIHPAADVPQMLPRVFAVGFFEVHPNKVHIMMLAILIFCGIAYLRRRNDILPIILAGIWFAWFFTIYSNTYYSMSRLIIPVFPVAVMAFTLAIRDLGKAITIRWRD